MVSARWLFTFHGRLGRGYWWLAFLVQIILIVAASAFAALVAPAGPRDDLPTGGANIPALVIMFGAFAVSTWISLATSAKRLHDLGASGWWVIPLFFVSMVGSTISSVGPPGAEPLNLVGMVLGLALIFGPIIYLGVVPGQRGENRFGPDTRGGIAATGPFSQDTNPSGGATSGRVESFSDELRELQRLRDDGVITQDEFDRKKKQILGI